MNLWAMFAHYPLEALPYELGMLLLACSMVWYSLVLRRLVAVLRERPIWLLPLCGALFLLLSVCMHSFAYLVLLPQLDSLRTAAAIEQLSAFILRWRTLSLASILMGGVCSLLGGGIYYRWTTR
jgi:hypothetical protein